MAKKEWPKRLVKRCQNVGWEVVNNKGHFRVYNEDGTYLFSFASTPRTERSGISTFQEAIDHGLVEKEEELEKKKEKERRDALMADRSKDVTLNYGKANGKQIITIQEMTLVSHGEELLLDDGTSAFRCTWQIKAENYMSYPCHKTFDTGNALRGHMMSHKKEAKKEEPKVEESPNKKPEEIATDKNLRKTLFELNQVLEEIEHTAEQIANLQESYNSLTAQSVRLTEELQRIIK